METIFQKAAVAASFVRKASLLLSAAILFSLAGAAQDTTRQESRDPYVNFLKLENGGLYFLVKYDNGQGRRFDLLVNGANGENLYKGYFSGKNFSKVFCAPAEYEKLQVIIREPGSKRAHRFQITSESRLVRETYVKAVAKRE